MRSSGYGQQPKRKAEPASPGLASNGKPFRIRLQKCPLDIINAMKRGAQARGFSMETRNAGGGKVTSTSFTLRETRAIKE